MVRMEPTADASLAAIFERNRFGIAIAAIIRMIATTIKSSISEKPFCLFRINLVSLLKMCMDCAPASRGLKEQPHCHFARAR